MGTSGNDNMAQKNNYQELQNDNNSDAYPSYSTDGSWWGWISCSRASLSCKDRPLVWAFRCCIDKAMSKAEARDTVAAALKGDVAAQRKMHLALHAAKDQTEPNIASKGGCCKPQPRDEARDGQSGAAA